MNSNAGMNKTIIKICGITREIDASNAIDFGADAIGLNFYQASPRFVAIDKASQIAGIVGNDSLKVGLFVNAGPDDVRKVLDKVALDVLQFHGDESPEYCEQFNHTYWKALRVNNIEEVNARMEAHTHAAAIVLDAWHPEQYGGTGETFDWALIEDLGQKQKIMLAGGLNPQNAAEAVQQVKPWGVDVSSGVEESPGHKSATLMKQFIEEVRRV